jgi:hypothetical protein
MLPKQQRQREIATVGFDDNSRKVPLCGRISEYSIRRMLCVSLDVLKGETKKKKKKRKELQHMDIGHSPSITNGRRGDRDAKSNQRRDKRYFTSSDSMYRDQHHKSFPPRRSRKERRGGSNNTHPRTFLGGCLSLLRRFLFSFSFLDSFMR